MAGIVNQSTTDPSGFGYALSRRAAPRTPRRRSQNAPACAYAAGFCRGCSRAGTRCAHVHGRRCLPQKQAVVVRECGDGIIATMDASSDRLRGVSPRRQRRSPTGSQHPLGQYLLAREQAYFDQTVADIFGFHALQIGLPECPFLAQSRIPSALDARLRSAGRHHRRSALAAVPGELGRPDRAAARARVHRRSAPHAARGLSRRSARKGRS